jgi:hypothetical protein
VGPIDCADVLLQAVCKTSVRLCVWVGRHAVIHYVHPVSSKSRARTLKDMMCAVSCAKGTNVWMWCSW